MGTQSERHLVKMVLGSTLNTDQRDAEHWRVRPGGSALISTKEPGEVTPGHREVPVG